MCLKNKKNPSDLNQCHQCTVKWPSQAWDGGVGWGMLLGGGLWLPLRCLPRELHVCSPGRLAALLGTAWKSVWACWAVLDTPSLSISLFYQFLVFQSKDGKMAQFVSPPFWRWVWFHTNSAIRWLGKVRFGISTLSYTVSCNSFLKISGKLGITAFRKSPGLQLQHRFRCVSIAQCIMPLKNKCLHLVMPLVRNGAVGFATWPVWFKPAYSPALQICLCVCWPPLFQNSEALGSWGQIQT